jgi:histidinol dehydrogenase
LTPAPAPVQTGSAEELLHWAERRRAQAASSPRAAEVRKKVAEILDRVRRDGDRAIRELAKEIDRKELEDIAFEVPSRSSLTVTKMTPVLAAAARSIERFCLAQPLVPAKVEDDGLVARVEPIPYHTVGVYAPGGRASYPSTVLMCVIPARVAGVRRIEVCCPNITFTVKEAASIAGATMLCGVGGAAAVAAMAFGTESVARCEKIVGPGNEWVVEAKRQVRDFVGIDSLAGPSEVVVVAGPGADAGTIALDLLAQLEHGPGGLAGLIATDPALADAVERRCGEMLAETGAPAWMSEALFVSKAKEEGEASAIADRVAGEHVSVQGEDEFCLRVAARIRHAGTVFIGSPAAVAFGDYCAGPSHVLPTGGQARFTSALSPLDFVRRVQFVEMDSRAAARLAPTAEALAREEGLALHAESVKARVKKGGG